MALYLLILVMSVFLGTELISVSTPVGQMTIYRLFVIGLVPIILIQIKQKTPTLNLYKNDLLTTHTYLLVLWWIFGFISFLWVYSLSHWVQGMFLLTVGFLAWLGIGYFTKTEEEWWKLLFGAWIMMTLLVIWGFIEIRYNYYPFADLEHLDPYNQFSRNMSARVPLTIFRNQNDFATMLLGYLTLNGLLLTRKRQKIWRLVLGVTLCASYYLILRTNSRMIFLSTIIFGLMIVVQRFEWKLLTKYKQRTFGILMAGIFGVYLIFPSIFEKLSRLYYQGGNRHLSGDVVRLNLYRNGLLFLGETFGFGVGAGNLPYWIVNHSFLPTETIVNSSPRWIYNMHNWWLEILVGYGILPFLAYLIIYVLYFIKLIQLKKAQPKYAWMHSLWIAFLVAYIPASITSANNMLIEWHWVMFGLLLSWVSINERKMKEEIYEY